MDRKKEIRNAIKNSLCDDEITKPLFQLGKDYLSNKLIEPLNNPDIWAILASVHGCKKDREDCTFTKCRHYTTCDSLIQALTGKVGRRQVGREEIESAIWKLEKLSPNEVSEGYKQWVNKLADAILSLVNRKE